jgi:hypothetical protein
MKVAGLIKPAALARLGVRCPKKLQRLWDASGRRVQRR